MPAVTAVVTRVRMAFMAPPIETANGVIGYAGGRVQRRDVDVRCFVFFNVAALHADGSGLYQQLRQPVRRQAAQRLFNQVERRQPAATASVGQFKRQAGADDGVRGQVDGLRVLPAGGHHGNGSRAAVRRYGGVGGSKYAVRQARYVALRYRVHFDHANDVLVLRVLLRELRPDLAGGVGAGIGQVHNVSCLRSAPYPAPPPSRSVSARSAPPKPRNGRAGLR